MTDRVASPADASVLTPFEDDLVTAAGIEIPGAGGGLRDALKFDPVELHIDQEVYIVFHLKTAKIRFDPRKDEDHEGELQRVHVMTVKNAVFVEPKLVAKLLDAQTAHIAERKRQEEIAAGRLELPLDKAAEDPFADEKTPRQTADQAARVLADESREMAGAGVGQDDNGETRG